MKTFNIPYVDVVKFTITDVITTSSEEEEGQDIPAIGDSCFH